MVAGIASTPIHARSSASACHANKPVIGRIKTACLPEGGGDEPRNRGNSRQRRDHFEIQTMRYANDEAISADTGQPRIRK
ncbi:hypothetical protein AB7M56_006137 [Bradyrhizobium elkanii]|nr:hypothetical protein [Bradyrhizobium elkanii]MCS4066966.1 hypothetical protein [Bradyrhizobium elkanii]MCS4082501.1 hypothetical protein [Bradyrhizobium elkanii]MCW2127880.1 hypothetical protein [Bradyrhizobium elkanii]MCW2174623.1 hypothetical protein [Bradyrhizobium elkanii]